MTLAAAGREVVIVERTDYRAPRVGEALPPAANPVLEQLGLTHDAMSKTHQRSPGTVCCWGSDDPYLNDYLFDPDGEGVHLDRAVFDAALARKAADAGATILVESEFQSRGQHRGRWSVDIACPRGDRRFQALTLIDAAGRRHWRGRPSCRRTFDRQIALVRMFEFDEGADIDRRTWIEAVCSGWWYSAAVPKNRLVVAYFTDANLLHVTHGNRPVVWDALLLKSRFMRDRLRFATPQSDLRVVAASNSIAHPIASEGYVAVGDAACTIDPLSSQGILYALTSGLDAAEALIDSSRPQAVLRYRRGVVARFARDLRIRQRFCQLERRWPDSPFWRHRVGMPETM
jgi:flavin-dependent dehydrogenase